MLRTTLIKVIIFASVAITGFASAVQATLAPPDKPVKETTVHGMKPVETGGRGQNPEGGRTNQGKGDNKGGGVGITIPFRK